MRLTPVANENTSVKSKINPLLRTSLFAVFAALAGCAGISNTSQDSFTKTTTPSEVTTKNTQHGTSVTLIGALTIAKPSVHTITAIINDQASGKKYQLRGGDPDTKRLLGQELAEWSKAKQPIAVQVKGLAYESSKTNYLTLKSINDLLMINPED